jgi:hypothetical protein
MKKPAAPRTDPHRRKTDTFLREKAGEERRSLMA